MQKLGIDISTYQNGINLKTAKEEGIEYVILRGSFTGYGSNKGIAKDDRFEQHYNNAIKNNLGVGVYHFSRATTYDEGKKEAEFLYNNCLKNKIFLYPIYIDVEDNVYQAKAGKNAVTNAIKGFCEYIEEKGFYVGVYCNLNWANNYMNYNELSKKYDFWLAYWGEEMPKRNTWGNYGMWQFGGETNLIKKNKIAGIICDQNYCYKDYPSIMRYNKLNNAEQNITTEQNKESNIKTTYTVRKGDTLYAISKKYKTTINKIYNDNKKAIGNNPNLIKPGQVLTISK